MQILVMPFYLPRTVNFPCNYKILTIKKDYFFFSYTYVTHKYKTQEPSNDFF